MLAARQQWHDTDTQSGVYKGKCRKKSWTTRHELSQTGQRSAETRGGSSLGRISAQKAVCRHPAAAHKPGEEVDGSAREIIAFVDLAGGSRMLSEYIISKTDVHTVSKVFMLRTAFSRHEFTRDCAFTFGGIHLSKEIPYVLLHREKKTPRVN